MPVPGMTRASSYDSSFSINRLARHRVRVGRLLTAPPREAHPSQVNKRIQKRAIGVRAHPKSSVFARWRSTPHIAMPKSSKHPALADADPRGFSVCGEHTASAMIWPMEKPCRRTSKMAVDVVGRGFPVDPDRDSGHHLTAGSRQAKCRRRRR